MGPSRDALSPGTRFAEYEILSVLGEGRSGIVYLAMDHGLERQVAIKEYLPAALASRGEGIEVTLRSEGHAATFARGLESFVSEARLLARFDHPALVRVYRFWEANGTAYMAMPYYEGVTVEVACRAMTHPPDEAWLRDLLLPLLDALDVLHGASCHHRNISPQNILLQAYGRAVLLDSGAARHIVGDRTEGATVILNPGFAPIEQYAESTQLRQGPWTDLYALAAVAYYCVSGESPMASTVRAVDDQMEPLFQVVDRIGRSFPELNYSVAFVSAIERALNVRPQERPQSVAEFRRALLGGRSSGKSLGVPPAIEKAKRRTASPPLTSSGEETAPFVVSPNPTKAECIEARKRQETAPAETAPKLQTPSAREPQSRVVSPAGQTPRLARDDTDDDAWLSALEAALSPDPAEFGELSQSGVDTNPEDFARSPQLRGEAKAGGRRRALFVVVAVAVLVVLGAGGWMLWSDYRDAKGPLPSLALAPEPDGRPAPVLTPPATVPSERPAQAPESGPPGAAAERLLPSPGTAAREAAPAEPASAEAPTVADAPVPASPPESPVVADEAPPPEKVVEKASNDPRVLCGPRTQFSLYRCMKDACDRAKYYDHPECKYLRVTDTVRASP
ncbi:serine/threonine protein kinase [Aromatoleum sp.]|uniref:serine/threonine protein kinase n=1 Tax=Aromatoleum sp. TaxID=2307007 RepID=UPI002FC71EF4